MTDEERDFILNEREFWFYTISKKLKIQRTRETYKGLMNRVELANDANKKRNPCKIYVELCENKFSCVVWFHLKKGYGHYFKALYDDQFAEIIAKNDKSMNEMIGVDK